MNSVSKTKPSVADLTKRVKELESIIADYQLGNKSLPEILDNFNRITRNKNAVYSINEFNLQCRFTYISPSIKQIAGFEPEELIGKSIFDYTHPEDKKTIILPLLKTYLNYKAKNLLKRKIRDQPQTFTCRLKDKSGNWYNAETTSNLIGNKLINITVDVRKQIDTQNKLQQSKVDYKNLLDNLSDIYFRINDKGLITDINPAIKKVAGYKPNELIGIPVKSVFKSNDDRYNFINEIKKKGLVKNFELELLGKDGSIIYVTANAYVLRDDDQNPIGVEGILHNDTDRKLAEIALKESEDKFRKAFLTSPDSININRLYDGLYVTINSGFTEITGYTDEDIIGKTTIEMDIWANPMDRKKLVHDLEKDGIVKNMEAQFRMKSGDIVDGLISAATIELNGTLHTISITRDITKRNKAETALQESERNMRFLANSALELLDCKTLKDITGYAVKKLHEIIDKEGVVFIVDYDYDTELWEMQEFEGLKPFTKKLINILGFDISKMNGSITTKYDLKRGKLKRLDDSLTELTRGVVPKKLNKSVMQLISMKNLYCIPFQKENEINGNVTIITNHNTKPLNKLLIEAFITQVSTFYENIKIDKELSESKEQYKDIVEKAKIAIVIDDKDGKFTFFNKRFPELFNYTAEEISKKSIRELVHPDDIERVMNYHDKRISGKDYESEYEFRGIKKDGSTVHFMINVIPFRDSGEIIGTRSYIWDITEKKQAQDLLNDSVEKYKDLVEKSDIAILIDDIDGKFVFFNDKFPALYDYTAKEIRNKAIRELVHPNDLKLIRDYHRKRVNGKDVISDYDFRAIKKDGSIINLSVKVNAIEKDGKIIGTRSYIWDITENKIAQKALIENEKNMTFLANSGMDLSILKTANQIYEYVGKKLFELMGKSGFIAIVDFNNKEGTWEVKKIMGLPRKIEQVSNLLGINIKELKGKRDPKNVKYLRKGEYTQIKENINEFTQGVVTKKLVNKAIKLLDVNSVFTIPFTKDTDIFGNVSIVTTTKSILLNKNLVETFIPQVTTFLDKIKAQDELKDSEEKFSKSFKSSPYIVGISTLNEGKYVDVNDKFVHVTGYSRKEAIGTTSTELNLWKNPHDRKSVRQMIEKHGRVRELEIELLLKNGDSLFSLFSAEKIMLSGIPHIIANVQDISEKKKAETALQESKKRFQDLYDNAPDMYFSLNPNGKIISVNEFGAKYLGYEKEELMGESFWIVVHPDDLITVKSQIGKILKEKPASSEMEFRKIRKDGTVLHVQERLQCIVDEKDELCELRINGRDVTENKFAQKKITDYQNNLKDLTNALIVAEEKERKRLAVSLHDTIGQLLAVSNMKLTELEKSVDRTKEKGEIKKVISYIKTAIRESRNLTYELSPPILYEAGTIRSL